jgi:hypothetical protein
MRSVQVTRYLVEHDHNKRKKRTWHSGTHDYAGVGEAPQSVEGSLQETDNKT